MSIIFPNQNNLTQPFDESWATLRPVLSSIQQVDGSYDVNQLTSDQLAMCLCTIQELVTSYNKIIESEHKDSEKYFNEFYNTIKPFANVLSLSDESCKDSDQVIKAVNAQINHLFSGFSSTSSPLSSSSSSSSSSAASSGEPAKPSSSVQPFLATEDARQNICKIRKEYGNIIVEINELCGRGFGYFDDDMLLERLHSETQLQVLVNILKFVIFLPSEIEYSKITQKSQQSFNLNIYLDYLHRFRILTGIKDKNEYLNPELVEGKLRDKIRARESSSSSGDIITPRRIQLLEVDRQIPLSTPATSNRAPSTVTLQLSRLNDEQIRRIVEELNSVDRHGAFGITEETIKQFLDRGGRIQLLEEGHQIPLKRGERYIVGCSSGVNRSQTHAAYMIRNGVGVDAILAGGDSGFNPTAAYPMLGDLYTSENDRAAFEAHFGFGKRPQFGFEFNGGVQLDQEKFEMVPGVREHYEGLVNRLEPTHFIAYAMSGPSVLKRLLDSNKPSLTGFTITFVNWADQIAHTPEGVTPCSQEAYRLFEERVAAHFPIID